MNTLQLLSSFALTGFVISVIAEYTKSFLTNAKDKTLYVIVLSVLGGIVVYWGHLIPVSFVDALIGVWGAANTVYVAIVQFLPNGVFVSTTPVMALAPTPVPVPPVPDAASVPIN